MPTLLGNRRMNIRRFRAWGEQHPIRNLRPPRHFCHIDHLRGWLHCAAMGSGRPGTKPEHCRDCGALLIEANRVKMGLSWRTRCRACWKAATAPQQAAHKVSYRAFHRDKVLAAYGSACECCGESRREFLAIDHVHGGGNKHVAALARAGTSLVMHVIRQGFPPDFRLLCHNCNQARGAYGYCPHERERTDSQEKAA